MRYVIALLLISMQMVPSVAFAARLKTFGFETNSITANHEWTSTSNTPTIVTTPIRTDTYAGRVSGFGSGNAYGFYYRLAGTTNAGPYYTKFAFRYATLPTAGNVIHWVSNGTSFAGVLTTDPNIKLTSTGTLQLFNGTTQVGSDSPALSANTWYEVEMQYDATGADGSETLKARLNQVEFAAATNLDITNSIRGMALTGNGFFEAQTTGDWYFDDAAINDSTGSTQTSYPGTGKVLRLSPSAAGDVNTFATQTGGTAGAGNNFTRVNEVTPGGATTFNGSNTLNEEDLYNMDNSGIGASDTVTLVEANAWHRASAASTNSTYKVEIEKAAAGTIAQGTAVTPSSTTFILNALAVPLPSSLILYLDPDGGAWTQTTVDSMQLGMKITTGNTNRADISTLWAYVEYVPYVAPPASTANSRQSVFIDE